MRNLINADYLLLTINIASFIMFGFDKLMAKTKRQRISEATLMIGTLCFGSFGSIMGMVLFNHKTSKKKFRYLVPVIVVINYLLVRNDYELMDILFHGCINKLSQLM